MDSAQNEQAALKLKGKKWIFVFNILFVLSVKLVYNVTNMI